MRKNKIKYSTFKTSVYRPSTTKKCLYKIGYDTKYYKKNHRS